MGKRKAGKAADFWRHLHGYLVNLGHLNAAIADDRTGLGQFNRLIDALGMDDGIAGQWIVPSTVSHTFGRYGFGGADRISRVDNRRIDPVEPALPAFDLDLGFRRRLGLLAAMIGEQKMGHAILRFFTGSRYSMGMTSRWRD